MIVRKKYGTLCALALLFVCQTAAGQSTSARRASKDSDSANQAGSLSELGRENANRVAASPAQIREALIKDPGLLVALKRLMAKEATANGQLVDDADLTDDAIFDRLGSDVIFRSVATRLVQKYGYLLPAVNPDSEIGKQQELILKERARRLVQIEAQEDAESLKPPSPTNDEPQAAATCPELLATPTQIQIVNRKKRAEDDTPVIRRKHQVLILRVQSVLPKFLR